MNQANQKENAYHHYLRQYPNTPEKNYTDLANIYYILK